MKATGIVRRIDDLGRVVIPKEIRRTMRIREGDPLEIYPSRDGEVIFKKYSLMGGLDDFAAQLCETMSRSTGAICAVTDRDSVIAVAGGAKRELLGKGITAQLEQVMENRRICRIFLYRAAYYNAQNGEENQANENEAECIVAKNRHGETSVVRLGWDGAHTRFSNLDVTHEF